MDNKALTILLLLLCLNTHVHSQTGESSGSGKSGDFNIWRMSFDLDGDIRTRLAYLSNPDMNYSTSDEELAWDTRGRVNLEITGDSPFYASSLLQWGNVELTQEKLEKKDIYDIKLQELYLGYKTPSLKIKAGIIDLNTPGKYVYDSHEPGIQVKYDFGFMETKAFYSAAELTKGSNESMKPFEYLDTLFFLGLSQKYFLDLDLWGMFYHGNTQIFEFNSSWLGIEASKEFKKFTLEAGYTYNFGEVTTYHIPLSASFSHMKLEYEPDKRKTFFSRFNLTSSSDGSLDSTGQFQTLDGEGNMETGMGLLFGGSSYDNQAYFDNKNLSIVNENLTDGSISFYDPGLFIYETGFSYDFKKILPVNLESEIVAGGANSGDLFEGKGYFYSLIGWEADLHNKIKLTEDLIFDLSLAYLLAGNSFNAVYELNDEDSLDLSDSAFKVDCQLKYSF